MRFPPYWSDELGMWVVEDDDIRPGTAIVTQRDPGITSFPPDDDDEVVSDG